MNNFLERLFHPESRREGSGVMDRNFVSDYTRFIDQFVADHPDVLKDQHDGRLLYWDKRVDLVAQEKAEKDSVPDDGYGAMADRMEETWSFGSKLRANFGC